MKRFTVGSILVVGALLLSGVSHADSPNFRVVVVPLDSGGSQSAYDVYLSNTSASNIAIDGFHLRKIGGGSQVIYPAKFNDSGFGFAGFDAASNTSTNLGRLNWSGTKTVWADNAGYSHRVHLSPANELGLFSSSSGTGYGVPVAGVWEFGVRNATSGTVEYSKGVCAAIPGDANLDGRVDSYDQDICNYFYEQYVDDETYPTWWWCDFDGDGYVGGSTDLSYSYGAAGKECQEKGTAPGTYKWACEDGWDNDSDGNIDLADGGCANSSDDSE